MSLNRIAAIFIEAKNCNCCRMGTAGCVAFRKQNVGYKKYYVTHDGYRSGLGRCLARFLESPKFSFQANFFDVIWAFHRFADPKDDGLIKLEEGKGAGPDTTYLVDLDAKLVVVASGSAYLKVPCVLPPLKEAVREVSFLMIKDDTYTLSDDVIGLPWRNVSDARFLQVPSKNLDSVRLAQSVLTEYSVLEQNDWTPYGHEELVVSILRLCAVVEDNTSLRSAASKALKLFEAFRKQRQELAEDPSFVEEKHCRDICNVYGVTRFTVPEFKEWCAEYESDIADE